MARMKGSGRKAGALFRSALLHRQGAMLRGMWWFVLLPWLWIGGAAAQDPPACDSAHEGIVACFGQTLCECRFDQGGQLTGRPSGHRWDCGILRPNCGPVPNALAPAQSLPPGVIVPILPPIAGPRRGY
jgi:hypothetical protein